MIEASEIESLRSHLDSATAVSPTALFDRLRALGLEMLSTDTDDPSALLVVLRGTASRERKPILLFAGTDKAGQDMLSAFLTATAYLHAKGAALSRDVIVGTGSANDIAKLFQVAGQPAFVIVGGASAPSASPAASAFVLTMKGKPAWIGNRHMLDNVHAVEKAERALDALRAAGLLVSETESTQMGVRVTGIIGGLTDDYTIWRPAMVPDTCSLLLEQVALDDDGTDMRARLISALDAVAAEDSEFRYALAMDSGSIFELHGLSSQNADGLSMQRIREALHLSHDDVPSTVSGAPCFRYGPEAVGNAPLAGATLAYHAETVATAIEDLAA